MNSNPPRPLLVRLDLPKAEAMLVNFRVRIEKSEAGCGTYRIEEVELQPATYEIQEFFLPFVSAVRNGMDSCLKQIFKQMP